MKCPVDQAELEQAGRTFACRTCDGAWVAEDALVAMLDASSSAVVDLHWDARIEPAPPRPCADCGAPMQPVALAGVALDRCAQHGIWFDAKELVTVFAHSKELRAPEHAHAGILRRIAAAFGR